MSRLPIARAGATRSMPVNGQAMTRGDPMDLLGAPVPMLPGTGQGLFVSVAAVQGLVKDSVFVILDTRKPLWLNSKEQSSGRLFQSD